jgi:cell wall-associated NlpC family hydrolase
VSERSLGTRLAMMGGGALLAVVLLAGAAGAGVASLLGLGGGASASGNDPPSATAADQIPAVMLALYQAAAAACPSVPWTVLAAIGTVESDNGQSTLPGVHTGANAAGAEGPMQFEPATFAAYDEPVPPGGATPPTPYDPTDAVYAAARLLCANGGSGGADLSQAVWDYNHTSDYVAKVLALAQSYGGTPAETVAATTAAGEAVDWALAQVGTPYVWGGETPGVGFDCSGLVQAAYKAAGVSLPRVAHTQFDAGPPVPPGAPLEPGDLVFFGGSDSDVDHVGLYVGTQGDQAVMVDAPYTGADVRVEPFPTAIGASFGSDIVVGFTRPSG